MKDFKTVFQVAGMFSLKKSGGHPQGPPSGNTLGDHLGRTSQKKNETFFLWLQRVEARLRNTTQRRLT